MNTALALAPANAPGPGIAFELRIFTRETYTEFVRMLRAPSFCVPTIAFPLMFFVLFGIVFVPAHAHPAAARHAFASFMVLGCMAAGLFALGVSLAADRERGILELKRALPMPRAVYLAAKTVMAMAFALVITVLLMGLALASGASGLSGARLAGFLGLAVVGVVPFCAIGLLVGSLARVSGTPALLNLIYLPMSFLSGLWLPLSLLPPALGRLAPLWPAWHLSQLAYALSGDAPLTGVGPHLLALAAWSVVCALGAARVLGRRR
jgi:ABC-2 type transport system permease protein